MDVDGSQIGENERKVVLSAVVAPLINSTC
jgi:hypothetical protein